MSNNTKIAEILAFVGLTGSGKTVAVDYLTEKGYPKVHFDGFIPDSDLKVNEKLSIYKDLISKNGKDFLALKIIDQIHDLINAGQHKIIVDGPLSWTEYKTLKHEFPGCMTTIAIITSRHLRHSRLINDPNRDISQDDVDKQDWFEIEELEKAGPIAIANLYISNNKDLSLLYKKLDKLIIDLNFS